MFKRMLLATTALVGTMSRHRLDRLSVVLSTTPIVGRG